ncbi:hypothetical protein Tco_1309627 [Tanacetum coccineum]
MDQVERVKTSKALKEIFLEFKDVSHDFIPDERCVWIDLVGLPLASWAPEGDCGNVTTNDMRMLSPVIVPEKDSFIAPHLHPRIWSYFDNVKEAILLHKCLSRTNKGCPVRSLCGYDA